MKLEISYDTKTGVYEERRDGAVTQTEKLDSFEMNWDRAGSITMKAKIAQPKAYTSGIGMIQTGTTINAADFDFSKVNLIGSNA